jgi:RND family efflux transporter MFP subunit
MNSMKIKALAVCGLCVLAINFGGCQKAKESKADPKTAADSVTVKVVATEIKEIPFEDWGSYSAELRGIEDAYLTAPYQGGRVNNIKPVGTHVKAGDALCDIDADKYDAALQATNAQVEVTKGDLERAKANVEKGSLGRAAVDGANLAFQNARMVQATATRAYQDCRCQAPFDGILVSRTIEKYQTVAPGAPTIRISRVDHLEAIISIPETEAFAYADGMKTEFSLLQDQSIIFEGKITSLDRAIDSRSRTATARIEIVNKDNVLKPGMVGRARILRRSFPNAIVVPSTALLRLQSGVSVMVVDNGIARQRPVKVGATDENSVMITEGLHAGEMLITSGAFEVSDGTRVTF